MMKISIIGNGAIGNVLAFSCHQLKLDYQVITRSGRPAELTVTDSNNKQWHLSLPVVQLNDLSHSEVIILPLKAYQIAEFIEKNQRLIHNKQTLVLLHNGMGTIEIVQQLLPNNSLIAATTTYGAFKPDEHSLQIKGLGGSDFGWVKLQPDCQQEAIEQVLSQLLPPASWHLDIRLALWHKLAINAAINPLTAIHNVNNGALRDNQFQAQIIPLCEELSELMTCLGFAIKPGELVHRVNKVIDDTAGNFSSMNRDVHAKRLTEIDFINGYIAKQAKEHDVLCPINLSLLNKVKALERSYTQKMNNLYSKSLELHGDGK